MSTQQIVLLGGAFAVIALLITIIMTWQWQQSCDHETKKNKKKKLFINYHLTRQCNYECGFCFHTAKTSYVTSLDDAKKGLKLLAEYGLRKVNFAGGEPFIVQRGKFVGELLKYCKNELNIETCSIVSNGSMANERWFKKYAQYLDIFAISCDSFIDEMNKKIGRFNKSKKSQTQIVQNVCALCDKYGVPFKINTVVNSYNWNENMVEEIKRLKPVRWKVFQCLLIDGENNGKDGRSARDAIPFLIEDEQFEHFVKTHAEIDELIAEDNSTMRNSYLLLDEYMRFLNCENGRKEPTESILKVGVENALDQCFWDTIMFKKREGDYKVSKQYMQCVCTSDIEDL